MLDADKLFSVRLHWMFCERVERLVVRQQILSNTPISLPSTSLQCTRGLLVRPSTTDKQILKGLACFGISSHLHSRQPWSSALIKLLGLILFQTYSWFSNYCAMFRVITRSFLKLDSTIFDWFYFFILNHPRFCLRNLASALLLLSVAEYLIKISSFDIISDIIRYFRNCRTKVLIALVINHTSFLFDTITQWKQRH